MKYVLILCSKKIFEKTEVLVVLKNRPIFQKDRYNLPGGKIEPHEKVEEAAKRELFEETGYETTNITLMGTIKSDESEIYCYLADLSHPDNPIRSREEETEIVSWIDLQILMSDPKTMPNLIAIIPMMLCECRGWVVDDNKRSEFFPSRIFSISV